jgi:hypothetical protein
MTLLPDQTPRLPKWPFLLADAVLLILAGAVAHFSRNPYAGAPLIAIVTCVALAALLCTIPFLADYARKQDEALDERHRALDALARTVNTSAEQISIAANGLNEIAEQTQKALRHAEHLPQKLHEKVAEFSAQLANANDEEKEELEKELNELRAADSERLESIADKITKSVAEWSKLEAATQKHFAAAAASLDEKLAALDAKSAALDTKLAALDAKIIALDAATKAFASAPPPPPPAPAAEEPAVPAEPAAKTETAHPPKRPRKPRPAPEETPATPSATPGEPVAPADESNPKSKIENQKSEEPPPVTAEKIPEVAPVAPHTAEPFKTQDKPENGGPTTEDRKETPASDLGPPSSEPKPPRKRAPKKPAPAPAPEGEPSLGIEEPPPPPPAAEISERAVSSDGATRLLVTAYIGIGNRLFIRGEGPGLSWDKGVPLQFVSIGKWRWETATADAPVKFKLYKNDETECTALGAQTLDPGHQAEVTAAF